MNYAPNSLKNEFQKKKKMRKIMDEKLKRPKKKAKNENRQGKN